MGENGFMFLDEKVGRASAFFLNKQWTKKLNMKMGNFNYRVDKPTKTWVYMRKKQQQQRIKLSHYLSVLDVYRTTRKMPYANTHVTIHTLMKTAYIINRLDCYWLETNSINNIYIVLLQSDLETCSLQTHEQYKVQRTTAAADTISLWRIFVEPINIRNCCQFSEKGLISVVLFGLYRRSKATMSKEMETLEYSTIRHT